MDDPLDHCLVIQITDLWQVPREELFRRIEALGGPRLPGAPTSQPVVLLRDPQLPSGELLSFARELRERTRSVGAWLWVNDRLDVAGVVDADGIHLGRRSVTVEDARAFLGPSIIVSLSAHSLDDVVHACDWRADVVMLSPIFASPGKGPPLGLDAVRTASGLAGRSLRVIALGGVDRVNGAACIDAGAGGVAAIRAELSSGGALCSFGAQRGGAYRAGR